jgi:hypothetical protein
MVEGEYYFVLHAPRQSGETTFIQALTDEINAEGRRYALNCSLASLRGIEDDAKAMDRTAAIINDAALCSRASALKTLAFPDDSISLSDAGVKIKKTLRRLRVNLDKDLVVFFDEADCMAGPALITFLAQIRDGYLERHLSDETNFPSSLALVGMRDVRDYVVQVRPDDQSIGLASPFNVKKKSLTLADFTREEIGALYSQHTEATGQVFDEEAVERAWYWSEGQPWLVNALADEIVESLNDCAETVMKIDVDEAAKSLISQNATHLDSLSERLKEPRVRRVMAPILASAAGLPFGLPADDLKYALDLGLLKRDGNDDASYRPANPIYREVIAGILSDEFRRTMPSDLTNKWMDGSRLDMNGLLRAFQVYWRENSEILIKKNQDYMVVETNEALAHLVLYAFF